jgi:hypothetical protein
MLVNDGNANVIKTTFKAMTGVRGSRIFATCSAGSTSVDYEHALSNEENHWAAAKKLIDRFNWGGQWIYGYDKGWRVFICTGKE